MSETSIRKELKILSIIVLFFLLLFICIVSNLFQTIMFMLCLTKSFFSSKVNGDLFVIFFKTILFVFKHALNAKIIVLNEKKFLKHSFKNSILISNHVSFFDTLLLAKLTIDKNNIKNTRCLLKNSIRYIPLFGIFISAMDLIFLKRKWSIDKEKIKQGVSKYEENVSSCCIVLFPEGTRFSESKKRKSDEYAEKKGLKSLKNVLTPRDKGFVLIMKTIDTSKTKTLIDVTIFCWNKKTKSLHIPSLKDIFSLEDLIFYVQVNEYKTKDLPKTEEKLSQWLMSCYERKDAFISEKKKQLTKES